ncbi:fungal-specific transcription factor domain-containing protein [Lipomyces oligophaga]|uniref:fungal-specific transcription factor domain-containing protein n=1 Tax=Lipomyces oligophaga TaxID=45792 RepID=UPI0034CF213E
MPDGSQAWKMIKPPGSQIGRIAQACDRCRSKKIRCDGKRPSCTQCSNVGFECRTSDKLSRRAFPRGYTESLEDHIRQLETENRQLKEQVEALDDKLELQSRIESVSPSVTSATLKRHSIASKSRSEPTSAAAAAAALASSPLSDDSMCCSDPHDPKLFFFIRDLQSLNMDGTFEGNSSGHGFGDILVDKLAGRSSSLASLARNLFSSVDLTSSLPRYHFDESYSTALPSLPPRSLADQLVTFFFLYWHPLFPVLHQPSFRADYERAYSTSTLLGKEEFLVELYLVFTLSSRVLSSSHPESRSAYERHWRRLLATIEHRNSLTTLQSLVLAQLDTCVAGQYSDMWQFKVKASGMALRLGLHLSHRSFKLNPLECEMRLRLFWSVYTLDVFSSALLGLPQILQSKIIECSYASDVDDEFLTERTILTAPPENHTKISASIALSKLARVIADVLAELYSSNSNGDAESSERDILSNQRSYKTVFDLDEMLDQWHSALPSHLKFDLVSVSGSQASSTAAIQSRAPFLEVVYNYTKILIHRCSVTSIETTSFNAASVLAMTDAAKAIIALSAYLRSHDTPWTICLNEPKTLLSCGLIVLFTGMDYPKSGILIQDARSVMTRCLDGMHNRVGLPSSEFRVFQNLSDALVGSSVSSSPSSISASSMPRFTDATMAATAAAAARVRGLSEDRGSSLAEKDSDQVSAAVAAAAVAAAFMRQQQKKTRDAEQHSEMPSMTIPHLPASTHESPNAFDILSSARHASLDEGLNLSISSAAPAEVGPTEADVLQWAISQHQQLQYRSSTSQIQEEGGHNENELENLFALMDGGSAHAGRQSKEMLQSKIPHAPASTHSVSSCGSQSSYESTSSRHRRSSVISLPASMSSKRNRSVSTLSAPSPMAMRSLTDSLFDATTAEINRALAGTSGKSRSGPGSGSGSGSSSSRSPASAMMSKIAKSGMPPRKMSDSAIFGRHRHRHRHRHGSINSGSSATLTPLHSSELGPNGSAAVATGEGKEWNMWWDDLFTSNPSSLSVHVASSVASASSAGSLESETSMSSAPPSVDFSEIPGSNTNSNAIDSPSSKPSVLMEEYVCTTPTEVLHMDLKESKHQGPAQANGDLVSDWIGTTSTACSETLHADKMDISI